MTQPLVLTRAPAPRPRSWTPLLVTHLVVVLAVLASAVASAGLLHNRDDGRDVGKDVLSIIRSAGATAAAQSTFKTTMTFHITGRGVNIATTSETLVDTLSGLSTGTMQLPGMTASLKEVTSANAIFVQLPNGRTDSAGHHWLSLPLAHGAASVGAQDPLEMLSMVGDPDRVQTLGHDRLHGIATTHYRVPLDASRLAASMAKAGYNVPTPPGALEKLGGTKFDLWVDENNLPRKMTMDFQFSGIKTSFLVEFLDFGQPITVTIPEPNDVSTASSAQDFDLRLQRALTS